jgi:hypothetical protein
MGRSNTGIHFNPNLGGYGTHAYRPRDEYDYRASRGLAGNLVSSILRNEDYDDDFDDDALIGAISEMRALTKKKGVKALLNGKVLNASRKKFRKWKRKDKKILKLIFKGVEQDMRRHYGIGKKKAKKARKTATKRIIRCFYGKEKKD